MDMKKHIKKVVAESVWGTYRNNAVNNYSTIYGELDKAMGKLSEYVSDVAYLKVFDADFQTVMRSVGFHKTPREVLTVRDLEVYHSKRMLEGREY